MLFLGTTNYPEINNYNQFLSQHGGASNAATYLDHTNYYFDVNPDKFEGALDRFSQFFIAPLFTESVTEKEINAVHSEHEKNLASDTWRLDQLDKSSAKSNHAYAKFGTGNKDTLEIIPKQKHLDVRKALLDFHNTWYSANIMSLCVLGKGRLKYFKI
jgi:insulysin